MPRKRDPNKDEYVIKCGLAKALLAPSLQDAISRRVLHVSRIAHRLSLFMYLRLLRDSVLFPSLQGQIRSFIIVVP